MRVAPLGGAKRSGQQGPVKKAPYSWAVCHRAPSVPMANTSVRPGDGDAAASALIGPVPTCSEALHVRLESRDLRQSASSVPMTNAAVGLPQARLPATALICGVPIG